MVEQAGVPVFKPSERKAAESFEKRTGRKPIIATEKQIKKGVGATSGAAKVFDIKQTELFRKQQQEAKIKLEEARKEAERKRLEEIKRAKIKLEEARKEAERKRSEAKRKGKISLIKKIQQDLRIKERKTKEEIKRVKRKLEEGITIIPKEESYIVEKKVGETPSGIPIYEPYLVTEKKDGKIKVTRPLTSQEKSIYKRQVEALKIPEKVEKTDIERLEQRTEKLLQDIQRGKTTPLKELELGALTAAGVIVGAGEGTIATIASLPSVPEKTISFVKSVIADPSMIKKIGKETYEKIQRGGLKFGQTLKLTPTIAIVKIGTEYIVLQGTSKALRATGLLTSRAITRISPKFKKIVKNVLSVPSIKKGKFKFNIIKVPSGRKALIKLKISPKIGRLPIKKQISIAGKRVTAVSAQADKLINVIKTKKIIRKPFRAEAKLSKTVKKLLEKFDKGTITKKQLIKLDTMIRREGQKGILERSFFADPTGTVRKRFLKTGKGLEKEASLYDLLTGDVTFKPRKPHIYIFEDVKIQKFPKTKIFKSIKIKLRKGSPLTKKETLELLKFQTKPTGKFKPLGFATTEAEVTLAPGEIIKKVKKVGVTLIDGKRVPIFHMKVVKAKKATKKLLEKARKGKLTSSDIQKLKKSLKKETGISTYLDSSRKGLTKKYYPIGSKFLSIALTKKIKKPYRKPVKRKIVRKPTIKKVVRKPIKRKIVRKPVKRRPIVRRVITRPTKVIKKIKAKEKRKKKKLKKPKVRSYHVYARPLKIKGKKRPKLIKVTKKPLKKSDARDLRNYLIDTSLSRTAKLKGSKLKPGKKVFKVPKGYASRTKKKFRGYKIVKGRKVKLRSSKVIERRKHLLDTRQEKKKITLRKRLAQLSKKPTKRKMKLKKKVKRRKR